MKFLILSGANVNLYTYRDPEMTGLLSYNGLVDYIYNCCNQMGIETDFYHSNHEGDLVDEIQNAPGRVDGIIINAGSYAQYSVAILDALRLCGVPAVEVVPDDLSEQEPFRKVDVVALGCQGRFVGEGPSGYIHACAYLAQLLRLEQGGPHIVS